MNKAFVKDLTSHFRKARTVGGKTLVQSKNMLVKNPIQSALFTLLAANVIKRAKSRKH